MYDTIQRTIAAWAFNHYIAYYYFDNVNVNQLKVAFEKGEVELENLPIKRDALKHLNLPMEVVSGIVGKLSIKVPLLTLLTDPWVIKITKLMLVVEPKNKTQPKADSNDTQAPSNSSSSLTASGSATVSAAAAESFASELKDRSQLNLMHEISNGNYSDYPDNSSIFDESTNSSIIDTGEVNSEETKLAEFYSSFSATVSAMVKDIYKNIRLEIESMTILFEEFEHGLVKFNVDNLLLHRPRTTRKLNLNNVSFDLADTGLPSLKNGDLLRIKFEEGNLDIIDESSNKMQLVVAQQDDAQQETLSNGSSEGKLKFSETRIEGFLETVSIVQLTDPGKITFKRPNPSNMSDCSDNFYDEISWSKRAILNCDKLNMELKLNNNPDEDSTNLSERNLHIKLDLIGMQYIHSHQIYEITTQRLMNLLKFFVGLKSRKDGNNTQILASRNYSNLNRSPVKKNDDSNFNKLLVINVEEGLVYIVDESSNSCAVPVLEFSLDDCRILQFSGKHQQNGFVFAKIGCNHFNREVSTWDTLLKPWPFNLSWDLKAIANGGLGKLVKHKKISLNSDEQANFIISSAFLDLFEVSLKRVIDGMINSTIRPYSTRLRIQDNFAHEFNSIFVLINETGHRLKIAPLEMPDDISKMRELHDSLRSSPTGYGGDETPMSLLHKLSIHSRSSGESRESPDLDFPARWTTVDVGETISFEFETFPIYKRRVTDCRSGSRSLLVRVEGWKTLAPVSLDRTGQFYREAGSDRVMYEDTHIMISIDLEKSSARKLISVKSPLNLINSLDQTLELHFIKSKQAFYIKPDNHLSVPLQYLHDSIHIRPCNAGVTMSEKAIIWDDIKRISSCQSEIVSCRPITVTDPRHESYSSSQSFRICLSTKRETFCSEDSMLDPAAISCPDVPIYTLKFIPPLTIINLLPSQLHYQVEGFKGALNKGSKQKFHLVDISTTTNLRFELKDFPESKTLRIDPGATGSFSQTLELFDKTNRTLYLKAEIILVSYGEKPAVQVVIYAPFWIINKTRLPIIFKQEGAVLEAAGQFHDHEESAQSILLFSFYDTELEPPWLCSMRLGRSKGTSLWCDGFKLEKGSGERRLCFLPDDKDRNSRMSKSLIDIDIRRGFGHFSKTTVVSLTARHGFDPLSKTPKKNTLPSPHNYKLTNYNQGVNLAEKLACRAVSLFSEQPKRGTSDISLVLPGLKVALVNNHQERLLETSLIGIVANFSTKTKEQIIDCSVQDVRVENTLPDCEKNIILDRAPKGLGGGVNTKPALKLIMDRVVGNSFGITLFKQVQLSMCDLVLNIEEKLVLKLVEFMSFRNRRRQREVGDLSREMDKILHPDEDRSSKYYFDLFSIDLSSLKLSVLTTTNLPAPLQKLKSYLGLKFFGFEEAQVELSSYVKMNVTKTFKDVFDSVTRFYKRQILEQAPRIVGQQIQNYFRFHLSDLLSTLYDEIYNKLFN